MILNKLSIGSSYIPNTTHCPRVISCSLPLNVKGICGIPITSMNLHSFSLRCIQRCFSTETQRRLSAINVEHLKPEIVLSEKNRKSFVEKFTSPNLPKTNGNATRAAVLVPLCIHKGELGFLYTLRSTKVTSHRGQVSFPGGMHDKEDENLEVTAMREIWEELKIPRGKIDVWTSGSMIDKKTVKVMPVFGYIGEIDTSSIQINTSEVEEAFFISLKNLCDLSLCRYTQFRDGYTLPVYMGGKHRVWGFTAAITHMVLNALVPNVYAHKLVHLRRVLPERCDKNVSQS